ncbi:hypothetical protein HPT25_26995 [Bacillus sp. BRMEA1]|uniref:hypothetical protein n=1 Tax=Neobacillus endophyticus TaxID=2738405 RepID=UPI001563E51D|nr:hypothetical protein [Neobacillus endophyticus]NRD80974.1 hypothetical protein [Neobacillus endophyticus]
MKRKNTSEVEKWIQQLLNDNRIVPLKGQIVEEHFQCYWIFILKCRMEFVKIST